MFRPVGRAAGYDFSGGLDAMLNIQTAQEAVAADDAYVGLVHSHDTSECFHYDSGAHVVVGERAAQVMLDLLGK
jgi:hypothetical protein